ncbi:hypothetical protein JCM5350_000235 [Sporobolomyces pararoseus]
MNPFQQQLNFEARTSHPQLATYAATTSPPPRIHVSMAERQVQVNPPPSLIVPGPPSSPLPSQPSLAQQEKENYYARSQQLQRQSEAPLSQSNNPSRLGGAKGGPNTIPPPILLPPPRAAFAQSNDSPLQSPVSWRQVQEFGDAGSIRSGSQGGSRVGLLSPGGPSKNANVNEATDWSRYSVLVKESEKNNRSEWLERKQGNQKKWFVVGWASSILLILAIILGIVLGIKNHKSDGGDGAPEILNLGIYNSKEVHSAASSTPSVLSTVSYSPSSSSITSKPTATQAVTSASIASVVQEVEIKEETMAETPATSTRVAVVETPSRKSTTTLISSTSSSSIVPRTTLTSFTSSISSTSRSGSTSSAVISTTGLAVGGGRNRKRFLDHASFVALRSSFVHEAFGRSRRSEGGGEERVTERREKRRMR